MSLLKQIISLFLILSIISTFQGCLQTKEVGNLNTTKWVKDENGCLGLRRALTDSLNNKFDFMFGMDELECKQILGHPNYIKLYERGQKFYEYSLTCDTLSTVSILSIRFNALGYVSEVLEKKGSNDPIK